MRAFLFAALLFSVLSIAPAQDTARGASQDTDHDGLSDALENALLTQFAPRFLVSSDDCAGRPAKFVPSLAQPVVQREDGTIYGQAFPRAGHANEVELHFYHLWGSDCGEMGHNLDTEHVSALVQRDSAAKWRALYWYAAAHEDTVCDASQIARAAAVDGEVRGPRVWISRGKHASFLSDALCTHGCGGDICRAMEPLATAKIVNLGELSAPMNGAIWVDSPEWPLAVKMSRSDFVAARTARVDDLPVASIAWANPGKRPMEAAILSGNDAVGGATTGLRAADTALDTADSHTGVALNSAASGTGKSLARTLHNVKKALHATAWNVGNALQAR
jgi:hypothetical protein